MIHIDYEMLVKNGEGLISSAEKQEIFEHLQKCVECAMQSQKLENFFKYVKNEDLEKVPQSVTANLLNIFQPKKQISKTPSFAEKLIAVLTFDDWQFALNERLAFSDTRQLLYKTDRFEIDIRLQFIAGKCRVNGQIFPDCQTGEIEIFDDNFSVKTVTDDYSEFGFEAIRQGIYGLRFVLDDVIIEIKDFSLLAQP